MRADLLRLLVWAGIGVLAVSAGVFKAAAHADERMFGVLVIAIGCGMVAYAIRCSFRIKARSPVDGAECLSASPAVAAASLLAPSDHEASVERIKPSPLCSRVCMFLDRTARCTTHQRLQAVHYLVPGGDEDDDLQPIEGKEHMCWGLELVMEHAILNILYVGQDPVELKVTLGPFFDSTDEGIRRDASQSRLWRSMIGQTLIAIVPIHMHASTAIDEFPIDGELMYLLHQQLTSLVKAEDWLRMGTTTFFQAHVGNEVYDVGITELELVFDTEVIRVDVYGEALTLTHAMRIIQS